MTKKTLVFIPVIVILILSSCTTMKVVPSEKAIDRFIELYNSGDTVRMTEMTSVPMLIDGEIVARSTDADFFWTRLAEAGFTLESSENLIVEPIYEDTRLLFADTMEVKTFFEKYVPETAVIVRARGPGGEFILLLSGRKGRYPFIFGFTGPLL